MLEYIKKTLIPLINTPLHPQWLVRSGSTDLNSLLASVKERSIVLDIGCFDKWARTQLPISATYVGIDYIVTANEWYNTCPDVYADAHVLPFNDGSFDVVLLLDVLEHLGDADMAMIEIQRVLRDGGQLIMNTPFLYPLHDQPRDFSRFSEHWYRGLMKKYGLKLESCSPQGHPVETSALLSNIAWSKTMLNWLRKRNPASVLIVLTPILILLNNIVARGVAMISVPDPFMPYSYRIVCSKVSVR